MEGTLTNIRPQTAGASLINANKKKSAFEAAQTFSVKDIWNISNRNFTSWGIEGYEIHKQYQDPLKQIRDREYAASTQKGKKNKNYVTKRGCYLEQIQKDAKARPGPGYYKHCTSHYNTTELDWIDPQIKQRYRKLKFGKRNTYIDQILTEQAKRPTPGVGKYTIRKSEKQVEEDIKEMGKKKHRVSDKRTYLNEIEFLGNDVPGVGHYQPHLPRKPLKKDSMNPKEWIKKHKRIASAKPFDFPCAATYEPEPTMFTTFSKLKTNYDKNPRPKSRNGFGNQVRFPNPKKTKSKSFMVTPGPDQYDLISYWKGKQNKKDEKKKNDWKNVSKGVQKNIYYE